MLIDSWTNGALPTESYEGYNFDIETEAPYIYDGCEEFDQNKAFFVLIMVPVAVIIYLYIFRFKLYNTIIISIWPHMSRQLIVITVDYKFRFSELVKL